MVGTWKGQPSNASEGKGLVGAMQGMASALIGESTLEFNEEGKFKQALSIGSETGTYTVSGNEVRLTPDGGQGKSMTLVLDGDTLRVKKEFASDPDIVFVRQSNAQP
ncbi:hypothetical protein OP10G_1790 [Fimbriimonas ginsengisoli Gsoil 348]|uniref:Lipocalin-like domain-containing protein n=1 Tax=Fimbriimonas ginsengisoli Gsoil 348 TaxID=661478 RepID=A0A068NNM8_FIMGI|nr:hypothetical protein OP10G_1790 [Fimbriimonas ginsengisoli Gsoil 348]